MCKEDCKCADESCKEDATCDACSHAKVMQGLDDGNNEKPIAATIQIDDWANHPERHGAMFDLTASEDVEFRKGEVKIIPLGIRMKLPEGYFGLVVPRSSTCLKHGIVMANSVGIIEPDYCGPNDVLGFVAYAVRGTKIAKGTRIAQFMPVKEFGDLDFNVVYRMPFPDRGGYGSTGEQSLEELHPTDFYGEQIALGDDVMDRISLSFGTVDCLYKKQGKPYALVCFDNGTSEGMPCCNLELDDRPRDLDGVPIEVGDVLYLVDGKGNPQCTERTVTGYEQGGFTSKELPHVVHEPEVHTHRKPDSFEAIALDALLDCDIYISGVLGEKNKASDDDSTLAARYERKKADLLRRMKAVAARG